MGGGYYTWPHLSYSGMKSGVGFTYSLCLGAVFLAAAILKGLDPEPLAIGCGTTLAEALVIVAAYFPATSGLGTPIHTVASVEKSWSWSS